MHLPWEEVVWWPFVVRRHPFFFHCCKQVQKEAKGNKKKQLKV
jgi:hypothetical protein